VLLKAAHDMLARYPTALWEDKQTVLEAAEANPADDEGGGAEVGGSNPGGGGGGDSGGEEEAERAPLPSKHVRLAVMMRIQEKTTLLAAARLLLKELPAAMGDEVCEKRYPKELELCKGRLTGVAFDAFDEPPPLDDDTDDDDTDDVDDYDGDDDDDDDDEHDGSLNERDEL
jgi:hypothetical protein